MKVLFVRQNITNKLLLAFFTVFILLATLDYSEYRENRKNSHILARQEQLEETQSAIAAIDDIFEDTSRSLNLASKLLEAKPSPKSILFILQSLVKENSDCVSAGILESDKQIYHYPPSTFYNAQISATGLTKNLAVLGIARLGATKYFAVAVGSRTTNAQPSMVYVVIKADHISDYLKPIIESYEHITVYDQLGTKICEIGKGSNHQEPPASTTTAVSQVSGWKVAIDQPAHGPWQPDSGTQRFLWLSALALVVAVFVFSIGNRIASPVRKLTRAAEAVSTGDFRRRVHIKTGDELQFLGESFNQMTGNLDKQRQALHLNARIQQTLLEIARTITSSLDLDKVAVSITEALKLQFAAKHAFIYRIGMTGAPVPLIPSKLEDPEAAERFVPIVEKTLAQTNGYSRARPFIHRNFDSIQEIVVALPLVADKRCVGALVATFDPETYTKEALQDQMDFLESVASWAAIALHNADTHGQTEELIHALDSLRRVDEAISKTLDLKQVLKELVNITAEVMEAKACAIFLADRNGSLAVAESNILDDHFGQNTLAEQEEPHGLIAAPLIVGHEALGTINVWRDHTHQAKKTEIDLLMYIASHAAAVIANSKLFGKEYQIAETLQNTLLSPVPDTLGRLKFGHRYLPALDEARVGGDLFDVINLPNQKVALIVADISGKGIQAAVHTSMIRYMMRAFIFEWPDSPSMVLDHLNRAISVYSEPKAVVTVFCAIVDPETGCVTYSNAGHPPAIVLTKDGKQQTLLYRTGLPIGYSEDSRYDERKVVLDPNDMLILYTDGIIEARRGRSMLTIEGLQDIIFDHARLEPSDMVSAICDQTSKFADRDLRDDIAIMAVTFGALAEIDSDENCALKGMKP